MGRRAVILFATHGNSTIGMGHIVRSLTLARELRHHSDEPIMFYLPEEDGIARYQVLAAGFGFWEGGNARVVVSDYADGRSRRIKGAEHVTLADVAEEAQPTDAVFATHGRSGQNVWSGPDYAILREQFAIVRATLRPMRAGVPRVLMSFGGADPNHLTEAVTASLCATPYRLTAVLGPAYRNAASYIERWGNRVTIHRPDVTITSSMADYMNRADLLLCSGGMTPIEAACVGTPTVVIAQNEREHTRMLYWQHAWTGYYLGPYHSVRHQDIQQAVVKLFADPETLDTMSLRGSSLVDGLGARRVAQTMLSMEVRAISAA